MVSIETPEGLGSVVKPLKQRSIERKLQSHLVLGGVAFVCALRLNVTQLSGCQLDKRLNAVFCTVVFNHKIDVFVAST